LTLSRTHWPGVLAVVAAGLAIALNVGKVPVALPALRSELGLSLVQAGWVSSMLTTVAVFSAAIVGMWVGRIGALRMVLGGLLVCAAASLLPVLAPAGWAVLIGSRFLEGFGFMIVAVTCPALITAASGHDQRRFALGLWSSYMPAGASIAMASAPFLLPMTGWRGLWVLTSVGLLMAAAALWVQRAHYGSRPAAQPAAPGSFIGPVRQALGRPLPWLLALGFGVWAIQHFALIVWMPTYLQEQRGVGAGATALLTSLMLVACVPGNLIGGALVQRGVPRGWLLVAAQTLTGLGALIYTTESLPDGLRYAAAVFVSFAGGMIPAAVMASSTVLARTPQQIGTLQGLYLQGAQLGQFVGTPLIAAVVAATAQWRSSLWVSGLASLIGIGLGLASQRLESRLAATAHP
jgi:MFS transporter, CP family, cyanate transporter